MKENKMMNRTIVREYKQGRKKNFFLRENNSTYFLEKITKACGFTVKAGTKEEVFDYIENNGFQLVGLIAK